VSKCHDGVIDYDRLRRPLGRVRHGGAGLQRAEAVKLAGQLFAIPLGHLLA